MTKKALKIISANLLITIGLLMLVEFASMLIVDASTLSKDIRRDFGLLDSGQGDTRASLSNYNGIDWATTHFKELKKALANYRSFYGWRKKEFHGETINIDSLGIRNTFRSKVDDTTQTIVFLGGSTMWGSGSDDVHTIPSWFVKKAGASYEAINYGEGGYTAYQGLLFLQVQHLKGLISPDILVSYDGVNNRFTYKRKWYSHSREKQINNLLRGADSEEKMLFLNHTKTLIKNIKKKYADPFTDISDKENQQAAIELLESWLGMKKLSDEINAKFICILQPHAFVGKPNIDNIEDRIDMRIKNSYSYYNYVLKYLNERERYRVLNNHFINMTRVFDGVPDVYIDFCHVSPNGNEIIANELLKHLMQN